MLEAGEAQSEQLPGSYCHTHTPMQEALPSLPSLGFLCSCHFPSPSSPHSSTSSPRPPFTPKASLLSQHSEASAQSWAGRCPFLGPLPQSSSLAPPPDSPPGSRWGGVGERSRDLGVAPAHSWSLPSVPFQYFCIASLPFPSSGSSRRSTPSAFIFWSRSTCCFSGVLVSPAFSSSLPVKG